MTEKYILIEGGVKDTANGITWDSFLELVIVLNGQSRQLQKLSVENEQLKSELKALRKKYNDFSDAVDKRLQEMDKGVLG